MIVLYISLLLSFFDLSPKEEPISLHLNYMGVNAASPSIPSKKKITIITPSIRPQNLRRLKDSINFNYVDEWIIVYDGRKIPPHFKQFAKEGNEKIKEYVHTSPGISGNPQRNFALDHIQNEDTYLYFLDDDNVIHQDLYKLLDILDDGKIYTFDQKDRLKGDKIEQTKIDTAMFLIDFKLCKEIRWAADEYSADFYYINECFSKNRDKWIYANNTLCTYNVLPRKTPSFRRAFKQFPTTRFLLTNFFSGSTF
jgi:hypothetical protein